MEWVVGKGQTVYLKIKDHTAESFRKTSETLGAIYKQYKLKESSLLEENGLKDQPTEVIADEEQDIDDHEPEDS